MIRVVFLDAGNTLFQERKTRGAIYAGIARRHGMDVDETGCDAAIRATHDALPAWIGPEFRYSPRWFDHFIDAVFGALDTGPVPPPMRRELFDAFATSSTYRLFDDVVPALDALRDAGFRLGVISNWAPHLDQILSGLGIRDRFETVIVSAVEKVEKPDPGIFHRAVHNLAVSAPEAAHVGDRPDLDVRGAEAAGLRGILLDRSATSAQRDRIRNLTELPKWFGRIP